MYLKLRIDALFCQFFHRLAASQSIGLGEEVTHQFIVGRDRFAFSMDWRRIGADLEGSRVRTLMDKERKDSKLGYMDESGHMGDSPR